MAFQEDEFRLRIGRIGGDDRVALGRFSAAVKRAKASAVRSAAVRTGALKGLRPHTRPSQVGQSAGRRCWRTNVSTTK